MAADVRYRRAAGWTWRWWNGQVLVMGPDAEASELGGAAAAAWAALDEPRTAGQLAVLAAASTAGATAEVSEGAEAGVGAESAVAEALASLMAAGLVEELG